MAAGRHETARRLGIAALATATDHRSTLQFLLHDAYRALGDLWGARRVLDQMKPANAEEDLDLLLNLAEDQHLLSSDANYRRSAEARGGFTHDEYAKKMKDAGNDFLNRALASPLSAARKPRLAKLLTTYGRAAEAAALTAAAKQEAGASVQPSTPGQTAKTGRIIGTLSWPDSSPVARATVALGLHVDVHDLDPAKYLHSDMHYQATIGQQSSLTAVTDDAGRYQIESVPAGRHEFLAVTLDPASYDICTRFLVHGVEVEENRDTVLNCTVTEWVSAAPRPTNKAAEPTRIYKGLSLRLVHVECMSNPFYFEFPRQLVQFDLPAGIGDSPARLLLISDSGTSIPFQILYGRIAFFTDLPPITDRVFAIYVADQDIAVPALPSLAPTVDADGTTAVIDTGRAQFRIAWNHASLESSGGVVGAVDLPPLVSVRGEDRTWRGRGRWRLPAGVTVVSRKVSITAAGPLVTTVELTYGFSTGDSYQVRLTAHAGEAYLLVHEISPGLKGAAFEFSLREFAGGRGFLQWCARSPQSMHWHTIEPEDRDMALLQESVPWWIHPAGFAYAMAAEGIDQKDYIGVFTIQRGEWIDREFERLAQGPIDGNYELDWPFPEMVGSTISMITARSTSDGDAFFRFGCFDGERRWGILVSTIERNDGPWLELSAVQHKNSWPRLQDFKDWRLDTSDAMTRPHLTARRDDLRGLRKKRTSPIFEKYWKGIDSGRVSGAANGLRFAVGGDPLVAWRKKRELVSVAHMRARMTLLGREYSDMYSPVGARPITPWAEDYDLIVASGVFTPEEERLVRSFLMLMGHAYVSTDHMNWKFNARNANFEADRVDVVASVGLCFAGNPDADRFIQHAAESMQRALTVYCNPDSGKWYENPACYYLQASKCRANMVFHLFRHGIFDPTTIPRLKEFLGWGVLLLTPNCPSSYDIMRDGATYEEYQQATRVRRISPIGDHAKLGPWVPEHYALMAKVFRTKDPAFADALLWAYQAGGSDGAYFGNIPLLFAALTEEDMRPAPAPTLPSRRLEGFGASFRGNFDRDNEFYLLFKQGPGGYRFHRTEGSIILFADGRPLIYDGGEAGETYRHSTLSFYDSHMPLAPGHVERFVSLPNADFCQGVHPRALKPGEPVFLSDGCRPEFVPIAFERFNEPNPADSRSVLWIKDQYVILHDELNLEPGTPNFWHLQVVAQGESGDAHQGYLFKGRFGVDLQVLLPDQSFTHDQVTHLPTHEYNLPPEKCFAMRHLHIGARDPDHYLAVLRPLTPGQSLVTASEIRTGSALAGVHVRGEGIDDMIFLSRKGMNFTSKDVLFEGKYAAVIRRAGNLQLTLFDGRRLHVEGITIESAGPSVTLIHGPAGDELHASGRGLVTINGLAKPYRLELQDDRTLVQLR